MNEAQMNLQALKLRLDELRDKERKLQRREGIKQALQKERAEAERLRDEADKKKSEITGLLAEKAVAVQQTATLIAKKMGEILPSGEAYFVVGDGGEVELGWNIEGHGKVPYGGLSGGQRVMFETALAHALTPPESENAIILVECAELGAEIDELLAHVEAHAQGRQIVACTCHQIKDAPHGWEAYTVFPAGKEEVPEWL